MKAGRWTLSSDASSVRLARDAIRDFLADTHGTRVDGDAAALIVSELVSNAIVHTDDSGATIELRIDERLGSVHIEVQDHNPRPPQPRADAVDAEGGRGLVIVDRIASRWGWDEIAGNGKQVWCDLSSRRPTAWR
ncbi:MAG TPA: ATP-binding protein [Acidimicrobiales bacterium]|nr:ATP-binding protein [Acidimicrobiales bacterium]